MLRIDRRFRNLAVALSAVAGFVDAIGFIKLGGFFVSFMSGNTTRAAVGVAEGSSAALLAAGLIATFVVGVIFGTFVAHIFRDHRQTAVLIFVTMLLMTAAVMGLTSLENGAIIAMTLAMGAENTVFERDGEVHIGVTYMTGTLVKLGQRLAGTLMGGDRWSWTPYFLLWLGLIVGAAVGAGIYPYLGLQALWLPAVAAAVLALVTWNITPRPSNAA